MHAFLRRITAPLLLLLCFGCSSVYYDAMEQVGVHKRDILVDRIEASSDAQLEGQEQFRSALEQFKSVVHVPPSDLEDAYQELQSTYDDSLAVSEEISSRIDAVDSVAEALFDEWEDELYLYSDSRLKSESARKLHATRGQYQQLLRAMRKAERSMQPVLATMHDQVLYLKHNLNAHAISAIKGELGLINRDVDRLNQEMQRAIDQASRFVQNLQQGTL